MRLVKQGLLCLISFVSITSGDKVLVVVKGANNVLGIGTLAIDGKADIVVTVRLGAVAGVDVSMVDTKSLNISTSSISSNESRNSSPVKSASTVGLLIKVGELNDASIPKLGRRSFEETTAARDMIEGRVGVNFVFDFAWLLFV